MLRILRSWGTSMRSRVEASAYIRWQLKNFKKKSTKPIGAWEDDKGRMRYNHECDHNHYGLQELRDLMDFIYEDTPRSKEEEVNDGN